jgi:hypothetical protein
MSGHQTETGFRNEGVRPSKDDDLTLIDRLKQAIFKSARGVENFDRQIPPLLRRAIDEVIDSPRTGRFTVDELEKTEKTYLGTKVEILLRNWLRFPKGKVLDLLIDGVEVDVKNTMADSWMIPIEAVGLPCLLVRTDEKLARFSIGLIIARPEYLRPGVNRDGKKGISSAGQQSIQWLLRDAQYPQNIWNNFSQEIRTKIVQPKSGTKRVAALFSYVQEKPISRSHILAVAPQKDAMKRIRKNGGARDLLAEDGIALLSGNYDKELISALGLAPCEKDEFISYTPKTERERSLLREKGLASSRSKSDES